MRNIRHIIAVILSVCFSSNLLAESYRLPTQQQVQKLVAAVWKSPPRSIDVTYYSTVKDNTRTEEKLRQIYKEAFDEEYGPDEELSAEMLERKNRGIQSNVESQLAAQHHGIKGKYRVRSDGIHWRIDQVYRRPERSTRKGTASEEFLPAKKLDANTPFETTVIETPSPTIGFELCTYSHSGKTAMVEKRKVSSTIVSNNKINNILMMPNAVILKMKLGTRNNESATEPYDINEPKVRQLCSGTLEGISVKIRPDTNEPDAKEIIEISLHNNEIDLTYTSLMICAKDDYSKVYYCQTPNPASNKPPVFTKACSNFDAQGIPRNVTEVIYDGKRNVRLHETYRIENVRLNIPIPKEVFEFNPADNYVVTDYRLPAAERQAAKIESMKSALRNEDSSGRRLEILIHLREFLKDDPAQLRDIAVSMLEDERDDIRRVSLFTLTSLLKDNPEDLRNIAISMQDDEDPIVQKMVTKILQRIESKKEE